MKNFIIIVLFPFFITAQETKLNEELIKKSIQWTKVASTGRDYEEAKKLLAIFHKTKPLASISFI